MRRLGPLLFALVACVWLNQSVAVAEWRDVRDRVWLTGDASWMETLRYPFTFLYRRSGDEQIYHSVALAVRGMEPDRVHMRDARARSGAHFEKELPAADGNYHAPYTEVPLEYPPAVLPAILAPSWVSTSLQGYSVAFGVEMGLTLTLAMALVHRAMRWSPSQAARSWWLGSAALLLHGAIAVQRLDALVALALALCLLAWSRQRRAWLGAAVGAAAAIKLLPLLLLAPVFGIDGEARRRAWRVVLPAIAVTLAGLAPLWLFGAEGARSFFAYHASRGLHAESFAASVLALLRLPFSPLGPATVSYGSFNLDDPAADRIAMLLTPTLPLLLGGYALWLARRERAPTSETKARTLVAGLCVLLLGAKVLSPQYLTWLLPFVGVLPRRALPWAALAWLLSQVYFRGYFDAVYGMTPLGIGTLLLRDGALLTLFFTTATPPGSDAAPPSGDHPDRRSSSRT